LRILLALVLLFTLNSTAQAVALECSTYPLITYAERTTIKHHLKPNLKPSTEWPKLSTKQRVEVCRTIAKMLRNLK
jgi:hypothetical protein